MKSLKFFALFVVFVCSFLNLQAQTTLINTKFDNTSPINFLTSDGTPNATKAADGVCSKGMIQINPVQKIQLDVSSCSSLVVNMKSTSTSTRTVTIKYKKGNAATYTTLLPTVSVLAAQSFNLTTIYPDLVSNESISIIIEATSGNTQVHDLVLVSSGLSSANKITSFKMNNQVGNEVINATNNTVAVNVLAGTNLTNVAPASIAVSSFAGISPLATATRNFASNSPVTYTVTAENGTTKVWTVIVSEVSSTLKEITDFKLRNSQFGASIINKNAGTITVNIPDSVNLGSLTPYYIYLSDNAVISPGINTAQNFNNPVVYTVTAPDNTTKNWTVNVNKIDVTGFPVVNFNEVIGFASMTADGFTGPTTGGGAIISGRTKDTVYINGPAEFAKLCTILQNRIKYKTYSNNPLTIVLEAGIYTGTGGVESVWANEMLTIQEQENLTIIGRKNVILNFGINVKRSSNLIIRNITIQDYYDDGINIGEPETHHVWVDHCTVGHPTTLPADSEHPDGGIDVKDGASYVTISWTKYRNSWKTGLVGHSDNPAQGVIDAGRLKITYYANHFYHTNSRNPRVRFGEVHVLNNLQENVMLYGIAAANSASVYAENNFFLNTVWGMYADRAETDFKAVFGNNSDDKFTSKTGNYPATGLKQVGNEYDDSGLPLITAQLNSAMLNPSGRSVKFDEFNPSSVFTPSTYYAYTPMSASVTRKIVPLLAGADVVDFFPKAKTSTTLPLTFLAFDAKVENQYDPSVKLTWTTTNEINTKDFEILRKGDDGDFVKIATVPAENKSGIQNYLLMDRSPIMGNNYYQLRQNDNDGKFSNSKIVVASFTSKAVLKAYPNPTNEILNVLHQSADKNAFIKIVGTEGRVFIKQTVAEGTFNSLVNVVALKTGVYFMVFENEGLITSVKFIKQ
ncbi:T9SS type A sorting domain-containing protein [Pedobacter alpinus]|uniref:T9SS type A sorting domain-containing protein n=1 Tax=Pedobacter alpinus TaxID=1590643 RepID=A0ABW5TVA3_9SPHI